MLVCTRAAQHETYEPVLVSEAELARAVTAYNKGKKPTLSKTGTDAEDWALHYLFKCGRVTISKDDKCEILGVDSFSLDDAMKCGNYSDVLLRRVAGHNARTLEARRRGRRQDRAGF